MLLRPVSSKPSVWWTSAPLPPSHSSNLRVKLLKPNLAFALWREVVGERARQGGTGVGTVGHSRVSRSGAWIPYASQLSFSSSTFALYHAIRTRRHFGLSFCCIARDTSSHSPMPCRPLFCASAFLFQTRRPYVDAYAPLPPVTRQVVRTLETSGVNALVESRQ